MQEGGGAYICRQKESSALSDLGGFYGKVLRLLRSRKESKVGVAAAETNTSTQKVFVDATPKTTLRLWPAFDSFAHLAASLGICLATAVICFLYLSFTTRASCCLSSCATTNVVFKLRHRPRRASSSARAEGGGGPDEIFLLSAS